MILSAQSIRKRCPIIQHEFDGVSLISPFCERTVHPCGLSFGLSSAGYDVRLGTTVQVAPRSYCLGATLERFIIPNNLLMRVHDKSTWARKGLFVQNTVAEPGWCGYLTLELSNETKDYIFMDEGTPIAQVIFELLDESTEQTYGGKYQDQAAGPQPARLERVEE